MQYLNYFIKSIPILALLLFNGCNYKSTIRTIIVKDFPSNHDLTSIQESKDDIFKFAYVDLKLMDDYVVVVDRKSDGVLHFLEKNSLNYKFSKIKSGNATNEIALPGPIQLIGNNLFLLDLLKKQFHQYDINKLNIQDSLLAEKKLNLSVKAIKDAKIIEPNSILVSGWMDDGLVWMLDSSGSKKKVIGDIPAGCPIGYTNISHFNMSHQFRIDLFPDHKRFVVSSMFSDKLQVFNVSGKELFTICGPDSIIPIFNLQTNSCSNPGDTKLGYFDVEVEEKYIYGLYYGHSQVAEGKTCSVFVFKHNGKPVARFNLDANVKAFDVDEENRVFYTLQLKPNKVLKYKFDF